MCARESEVVVEPLEYFDGLAGEFFELDGIAAAGTPGLLQAHVPLGLFVPCVGGGEEGIVEYLG